MTDLADRIKRLRVELPDLHKQATTERSHYYVGSRCDDSLQTINQLVELVAEMQIAMKKIIEQGVQKVEGVYSRKNNQCHHHKYGYEGCEDCIIEFLEPYQNKADALLTGLGEV